MPFGLRTLHRPRSRRSRRSAALALGACLAAAWAGSAPAHPLAPALLELEQSADGRVDVHWKTSRLRPRGVELTPRLPADCRRTSETRAGGDEQSVSLRWTADCGARGLVDREVGIDGLGPVSIDVLLRVALPDGRVVREVLRRGRTAITVPARQTKSQVGWGYLVLGFEHILGGLDHLLFVLGLMLLVSDARALVKTITAFTLGHSLTLSLATLGIARVPSSLAELLIAASILVLAVELAAPRREHPHLLQRRPWLMACTFGLVHGLGFAGALTEVGLPQEEIPLALFAFNVGIEVGQLAFVAVVAGLAWAASRLVTDLPAWLRRVPAYAIGSCAAFWCFERAAQL